MRSTLLPMLSIVIPAYDEAPNIAPLLAEVEAAMIDAGVVFECIVVDDGSTDGTLARLLDAAATRPWLRVLHRDQRAGQSAAFHAGVRAARADWIGMLDADLQNDSADLLRLFAVAREQGVDWAQGRRSRREDGAWRAFSSWVGRVFRSAFLRDAIRDTGCSCRIFRREIGLALPLQYAGMHRFMPIYAHKIGYAVIEVDVRHRDRVAGRAKYGALNRALPGLVDLFAVRWMFKRLRDARVEERTPEPRRAEQPAVLVNQPQPQPAER